jgi:hypothetical protein
MTATGRQAAVAALVKFRRAGAWAEIAVDSIVRENNLDSREAALCSRLVYGVLQNLAFLDFVIGRYSSTPINRMEPKVSDILRVRLIKSFVWTGYLFQRRSARGLRFVSAADAKEPRGSLTPFCGGSPKIAALCLRYREREQPGTCPCDTATPCGSLMS